MKSRIYILILLGLKLKFSKLVIKGGDVTFEGSMAPIIDLDTY